MEDVYEPDWSTEERLDYTIQVADVLADIAAPGIRPTIQTAPLAYRANVDRRRLRRLAGGAPDARRRPPRRPRAAYGRPGGARPRARAGVLARDHGRDGHLLRGAHLLRRGPHALRPPQRRAALPRGGPAPPAPRRRVRHLPPVGRVRGHPRVAREPGRRRRADPQAAGRLGPPGATRSTPRSWPSSRRSPTRSTSARPPRGAEASTYATSTSPTPSPASAPTRPAAASGAPTSTSRSSSTTSAPSARRGPGSRTRCACTRTTPLSEHLEIETYTWDVLPAHLKTGGDIVDYVSRELSLGDRDQLVAAERVRAPRT